MNAKCDVCIEEQCKGEKNCNCATCDKVDECNKALRPTIRITTLCTQACSHCCFKCSPKTGEHMSIEVARQINRFLVNNSVVSANVMGGEFFCNPDWFEILRLLAEPLESVRLVSNGDWAGVQIASSVAEKISILTNVYVAISNDRWHTNKYVEKATELLDAAGVKCIIQGDDDSNNDIFSPVVPIGRSVFDVGTFYTTFGCFCNKQLYSFMIDETGIIYKCPFGIWDYATVQEYEDGGFRSEFKRYHQLFYKTFISSCRSCIQAHEISLRKERKQVNG